MKDRPLYRRVFRSPRETPDHAELDEEMRFHIDSIEEELVAAGRTPEDAAREALARFGDPSSVKTAVREQATGTGRTGMKKIADDVLQDLGFAVRQLTRKPLVFGMVLATLVLGVSAAAIVYSVVDAVVLQPLPFDRPDDLYRVTQTSPQGQHYSISEPNLFDFRARQRSFEDIAGIGLVRPVLTGDGEAESLEGLRVTHSIFSMVGVDVLLGRSFTPEEDLNGAPPDVVLLSEATWRQRYAADPEVLGRVLVLDGMARTVVGVVASDRSWPGAQVFLPLAPHPDFDRDNQLIDGIARILPGVSLDDARADLSQIAAELSDAYPESNDRWGVAVVPARDWLIGPRLTSMGLLLLGAVALLLLMTCASVSNLMVAQATTRLREMGVRAALGAGKRRVARQLITEGLLLATVGGGLALLIASAGLPAVKGLGPADLGRLSDATLSAGAMTVGLVSAILTVLVAGIAPLALLARGGVAHELRSGQGRVIGQSRRIRDGLVVTQFALALTVALGAGLMTRSFQQLQQVDLGFESDGMVRFNVRLPPTDFDQTQRVDYLLRLEDELVAVPGVLAMGASQSAPFGRFTPSNFVARSDQEPARQQDFLPVSWRAVSGAYFRAMDLELLAGRAFDRSDRPLPDGSWQANPAVIIDRVLADILWPDGEDPIGRFLTWFLPGGVQHRVVGVVEVARDERIEEARPRIYKPYAYAAWEEPAVLVRTAGDPAALIPALRRAVLTVDSDVPAIEPMPVGDDLREAVAWPRFGMQVIGAFGLAALLLAAMGISGVTAFSVRQRRQEIGVRVALGAEPGSLVGLVLRRVLRLAALGIALGLMLSLALASSLRSLLYDVSATDPVTFIGIPLLLTVTAVLATWLPARRAVRVAPRSALVGE